jgi:hypothetical protein
MLAIASSKSRKNVSRPPEMVGSVSMTAPNTATTMRMASAQLIGDMPCLGQAAGWSCR